MEQHLGMAGGFFGLIYNTEKMEPIPDDSFEFLYIWRQEKRPVYKLPVCNVWNGTICIGLDILGVGVGVGGEQALHFLHHFYWPPLGGGD